VGETPKIATLFSSFTDELLS